MAADTTVVAYVTVELILTSTDLDNAGGSVIQAAQDLLGPTGAVVVEVCL